MIRFILAALAISFSTSALGRASFVQTPYQPPKAVFDFYFDEPEKINAALYWLRSLINPLSAEPYAMTPEDMSIVVVIHGTEIVSLAASNYEKYGDAVERMRYYAELGVSFRVCALAAHDYGYTLEDFPDFVEMVPSAFPELVHWQSKGYALIAPQVLERKHAIEDIR